MPAFRKPSPLAISLGIIVAIGAVLLSAAGAYTDWLWFKQLGFEEVFITEIVARVVLFSVAFLAMGLLTWLALHLAYRSRPVFIRMPGESAFEAYQQTLDSLRKVVILGVPALLGVFAGLAASANWQDALLFLNSSEAGATDAQFGLDAGFYMFQLPFLSSVVGFVSSIFLIAGLSAAAVQLVYGGIRITGRDVKISKPARIQLAVTVALYFAAQGISLWLSQYATTTTDGALFTGAAYTDVNAVIPGLQIMALIGLVVAVLFLVTAFIAKWKIAIMGTALMVASSLILGGLFPWVVQTFQVVPNERTLESEFLQRNIEATRYGYGLDAVEVVDYDATTVAEPGALRADAETTASIRLLDPTLVSNAFRQLEQYKQYYSFPERLHVDRYEIDGEMQDTVVAVRELNQAGLGDGQSWYNSTIVYTHGFGFVAAYGNKRDSDGKPRFLQSGIPSTGLLGEFEPRIYFGANSPLYSIVGAEADGEALEFDYPAGVDGENQTYNTFSGDGGPRLGDLFTRTAYALKFQSEQILLSDAIGSDSQILYNRDPRQRVQEVAPYLTLDSEIYPAVVDGQILWIVDGYTTSSQYPYSNLENFNAAILDSASESFGSGPGNVNYIRNSVKATVSAYDGKVTLYEWDSKDPILQTWKKIYPGALTPRSEMTPDLVAHLRYPSDLFKVQRSVLGDYHVTEAGAFYSQQDAWMTPNDPVEGAGLGTLQPPYYLTMQAPGSEAPAFSLYSTFIPRSAGESGRNVLTGYLIANADAGVDPNALNSEYGKLTLLTLPRDTIVPGPGQVQNIFDADSEVSRLLNLLRQGSTRVLSGNLLTLPVGGGLLYVQPVYIESTGETSYPLLQKVLVAFGDRVAFEDTLDEALDSLFGGDSGAEAGDGDGSDSETPTTPTEPGDGGTDGGSTTDNPALKAALDRAALALEARTAALQDGDWTAYGEADEQLQAAIEEALAAIAG